MKSTSYYDAKKQELDDKKILEKLKQLPAMYENGEIAEVKDEMIDLVNSLQEFEDDYK